MTTETRPLIQRASKLILAIAGCGVLVALAFTFGANRTPSYDNDAAQQPAVTATSATSKPTDFNTFTCKEWLAYEADGRQTSYQSMSVNSTTPIPVFTPVSPITIPTETTGSGLPNSGAKSTFTVNLDPRESIHFTAVGCAPSGDNWVAVRLNDVATYDWFTAFDYSYSTAVDPTTSTASLAGDSGTYTPKQIVAEGASSVLVFAVPKNESDFSLTAHLVYSATRDASGDTPAADANYAIVPTGSIPLSFDVRASFKLTGLDKSCEASDSWC